MWTDELSIFYLDLITNEILFFGCDKLGVSEEGKTQTYIYFIFDTFSKTSFTFLP